MTRNKSLYAQDTCNHHRLSYPVYISNNVTFLSNIFDEQLVEPNGACGTHKNGGGTTLIHSDLKGMLVKLLLSPTPEKNEEVGSITKDNF